MTDFRSLLQNPGIIEDLGQINTNVLKHHKQTEKSGLVSKNFDNDDTLKGFYEYKNTFRPRLIPKDPETFCFFGSSEVRYNNAFRNILDYYPFDGTQSEFLDWHTSSSPMEVALAEKHWPSSVGHLKITNQEYVNFYAGPQEIIGSEYTGKFQKSETPLRIDYDKGSTVEFWLRKEGYLNTEETIFDVGSHPSHVPEKAARFRVYLKESPADAASPFHVDYLSGTLGFDAKQVGEAFTNANLLDNNWHHYAFRVYQSGSESQKSVYLDMFIDGKKNASVTQVLTAEIILGPQDSYMAGCLFAPLNSSQGTFSGSLDEFRFWKGQRSNRELNRFYDQKVFASDLSNETYPNRLGVYYKFNKKVIGDTKSDSVLVDYSGNDMPAKISDYQNNTTREQTSAIDSSSASSNTEIPDLSLLSTDTRIKELKDELIAIARSYDKNNHGSILKKLPDWAVDPSGDRFGNEKTDFYILLDLIAEEFDNIKLNIDSVKFLANRNFDSNYASLGESSKALSSLNNSSQVNTFTCSDSVKDLDIWPGNRIDFPKKNLEKLGFNITTEPIGMNINPEDDFENIIGNVRLSMNPSDVKGLILDNILIAANSILKKKGTERSFDQLLSCWGVDRNLVTYNVYGQNSEIDLEITTKSSKIVKMNSLNFSQATGSVLFMSATLAGAGGDAEINYIPQTQDESALQESFTFEGNFIFPKINAESPTIARSSVFGLKSIDKTKTKFHVYSGAHANMHINVATMPNNPEAAKFEMSSSFGNLESSYFTSVYDNSQWNLSLRIQRSGSLDARFMAASSVSTDNKYQIIFSGHNYVLDSLQNSFKKIQEISHSDYVKIVESDKTLFVGAIRDNITGSLAFPSNCKFLNIKAWNTALTDTEIQDLSQNISSWGISNNTHHSVDYSATPTDASRSRSLLFRTDISNYNSVPSTGLLKLSDFTSGSTAQVTLLGLKRGSKYPFSSTLIDEDVRQTIIQPEYINIMKSNPLELIKTSDEVKVKTSDLAKFEANINDRSKIFSFEKSMYRQISEEMIDFLSGVKTFNNLIGEPANKYRPKYKLMDHFRSVFYENVENENQFERYVEYYKWIDLSLGSLLSQIVPASSQANTGLQNVVESHILERNKYQYKFPIIKAMPQLIIQEIESAVENTNNSPGHSAVYAAEADAEYRVIPATAAKTSAAATNQNQGTNGRRRRKRN
jgi:hypothetical protein